MRIGTGAVDGWRPAGCVRWFVPLVFGLALAGCDGNAGGSGGAESGELPDGTMDDPVYPSAEWEARELANYARVLEAPAEQVANPAFMTALLSRSATNISDYASRAVSDPSWLLAHPSVLQDLTGLLEDDADWLLDLAGRIEADPHAALGLSFGSPLTPLCATYAGPCVGDPFAYPSSDGFDTEEVDVSPVVFYDRACTRLSGRVWAPSGEPSSATGFPAVVIQTGSIQAPQTVHWWAARALARAGYVVLTFDVRGQGRSDTTAPGGAPGSDLDPTVFWQEMVDAIDFLHSSPTVPYPHDAACEGTYPTATTAHNPRWEVTDPERLGLAGHSTGGYSVAVVQSYGGEGAPAWPGLLDEKNPVDAVVAWDGMIDPQGEFGAYGQLEFLDVPLYRELFETISGQLAGGTPVVVPRVPAMMHFSDYGAAPVPYLSPPPAQAYKRGLNAWRDAGVPAYALTIRGSSHYEWSLLPLFPATSWCPEIVNGRCEGGWGLPMARHYTVAWFDRWLKREGEPGFADADARLLDDGRFRGRFSYHFESGRAFPDREGRMRVCESIRHGC